MPKTKILFLGTSAASSIGDDPSFDTVTAAEGFITSEHDYGTIANGDTLTLDPAYRLWKVTFGGATATVAYGAGTYDGLYRGRITCSAAQCVLTVPSTINPAVDNNTGLTTLTYDGVNARGRIVLEAEGGALTLISTDGNTPALITFAQLQTVSTAVTLGRRTAGTGAIEENTAAQQWANDRSGRILHYQTCFDPKVVCDATIDRLPIMQVGLNAPSGIVIDGWKLSFEADPTTEVDLDLKRADAYIGVANAAVMDVLDTTAGASSESTGANINSGATIANGKFIYLEFGTAYTETGHIVTFDMYYHAV